MGPPINDAGVHFARNARVPKTHTGMLAAVFRTIFAQPGTKTVAATWDRLALQQPR
jgi:hypothetical protein